MARLLRGRTVAIVLVGLAAVIGSLYLIPSDHYIFLPDRARAADPLVRIPGERKASGEAGIYMVDILVRRASLLERLLPGIEEGATLVPARVVNPSGETDEERREESLDQMSLSQRVAAAVALRSLGYEVEAIPRGAEVIDVTSGSPAEGKLEPEDVIVQVNGKRVTSLESLQMVMMDVRPGQTVPVVVDRGDRRTRIEVGTKENPMRQGRAVFGVAVQESVDIDLPVNVRIDAGQIGGPSAGLAFALEIVDGLGRDIDRGRTVVATGAIALDGTVVEIGGIKQKTIGANEAGADVFLVPDANAAEARRHADGLRIVPVSSFREALSALQTG